jgi:hypothetical protein
MIQPSTIPVTACGAQQQYHYPRKIQSAHTGVKLFSGIFGKLRRMNKRETVVFRVEDDWVHDCIQKIVDAKKDIGLPTSFSFEATRLMKGALLSSVEGAELDALILKGVKDERT